MSYSAAPSREDGVELRSISDARNHEFWEDNSWEISTPAASTTHLRQGKQDYHPLNDLDGSNSQGGPIHVATSVPSNSQQTRWRVWRWEILSCLTSIGCTVALVAVLIAFNHHTLPSWPLGITLNALISVLAVFAKAATLVVVASCISQLKWHWFSTAHNLQDFEIFDEASRGPAGAISLLYRLTPFHLVTIGAALTVLAVAVDPFVQQIVGFEQHAIEMPGETHAYRAQSYDAGLWFQDGGLQVGSEFGMKSAIYTGLFGSPSTTEPIPNCGTGNCTFAPFTSLAVCSKCANVTDQTTKLTTEEVEPIVRGDVAHNITYSLPGNVVMNTTYTEFVTDENDVSLDYGSAMTSRTDHSNEMTREMFNITSPITALSILQFPTVNAAGYSGNFTKAIPLAWECALYFCINTYSVNVSNGIPSTHQLSSWFDATASPIDIDLGGTTVLTLPSSFLTDAKLSGLSPSRASQNLSFSVSSDTLLALSAYLNHTLAGDMQLETELVPYGTFVNDVLSVLNYTADISSLFENISTSMTNYIRSGVPLDPISTFSEGVAYSNEVFIRVRWGWIILLVIIVLTAAAFLAATITVSSREQVWKQSSLASMFRGMDGGGESLAEMRRAAGHKQVVLGRDVSGRWKLVPVDLTHSTWS